MYILNDIVCNRSESALGLKMLWLKDHWEYWKEPESVNSLFLNLDQESLEAQVKYTWSSAQCSPPLF